jgi:serine/threonine protein kinase
LAPYQITKLDQIASAGASTVYTGKLSHLPNQVVTVKVLKTRPAGGNVKPHEAERSVIHQADMWLREYQSQDALQHESTVKLFGGDARHLALYMEHVDGRDLSARGVWRSQTNDLFIGTKADAIRIIRDITSALHYIHGRNLLHNDIKPSNILYSPEQGATLCDFGLSTYTREAPAMGGTPYYVPPEFIGRKLRGAPSDVWALGITMLYVLRKIPLPESRGGRAHPKRLWWLIADLNRGGGNRMQQSISAVTQMQMWLSEIAEARSRLNPREKMEKLVSEMLVPNPRQRISVADVLDTMFSDEPTSVAN